MDIHRQVTLQPNLFFAVMHLRGKVTRRRLRAGGNILRELNLRDLLQEADEHERCFIVRELC